jgi:hypothetical protein
MGDFSTAAWLRATLLITSMSVCPLFTDGYPLPHVGR